MTLSQSFTDLRLAVEQDDGSKLDALLIHDKWLAFGKEIQHEQLIRAMIPQSPIDQQSTLMTHLTTQIERKV